MKYDFDNYQTQSPILISTYSKVLSMKLNPNFIKSVTLGWCVIFGVIHLLWLFGYYIGLPAEGAAQAFTRTWFWYYNLFAALACFIGMFIALGLTAEQRKLKWHKIVIIGGWFFTILLFLRSAGALFQFIRMVSKGVAAINVFLFWDFWFCIGFVAFLCSLRYYYRKKSRVFV